MRILVIDGPNLNLVGTREPAIYGSETLDQIHERVRGRAAERGVEVDFYQSNHEGRILDRLHQRDFDGVVINAGGLTHTSVALRDALLGVARPFVEVHLSDPSTREPFRSVNFLHDVAVASVAGQGPQGYVLGLDAIVDHLGDTGPGRRAAGRLTEPTLIDLRGMPMDPRHELLFGTLFRLHPGESMEVTNDHDPSGLQARLATEHPGRFRWTWLEQGPVDWRFRVDRMAGDASA